MKQVEFETGEPILQIAPGRMRRLVAAQSRADFIEESRPRVRRRVGYQLDFQQSRMMDGELLDAKARVARAQQDYSTAGFGIAYQRCEHAPGVGRDASMFRGNVAQPKSYSRNPVSVD
jgi:hypothetical protein